MSAKNLDKHNRFRSITVGFRVSPEEADELNAAAALSGLPKKEYCYRRCMNREVIVQGNPRAVSYTHLYQSPMEPHSFHCFLFYYKYRTTLCIKRKPFSSRKQKIG